MSAIKDFFKKKKADAKFKLAGSGHKLSEPSAAPRGGPGPSGGQRPAAGGQPSMWHQDQYRQTSNNQKPNKEKTERNGSVPSGDRDAVVNHSPKSGGGLMSPGGPPGSVALPGLVSHSATGVSVTVSNGDTRLTGHYNGRLYSPESETSPPTPPAARPARPPPAAGQPPRSAGRGPG